MIEFGGVIYYLDIDAFDKAISNPNAEPTEIMTIVDKKTVTNVSGETSTEVVESFRERGKEIVASKYDLLRIMIDILMDEKGDADDSLGADRALEKTSLSFKIAFNTLYNYGIIKEQE